MGFQPQLGARPQPFPRSLTFLLRDSRRRILYNVCQSRPNFPIETRRMAKVLTVNTRVFELSCRHTVPEHEVDLTEGTVLGLWQTEPAPDVAEQVSACVK